MIPQFQFIDTQNNYLRDSMIVTVLPGFIMAVGSIRVGVYWVNT